MKKLLLVDAMSIMHRSYYGYPNLMDKTGRSTGALFGFVTYLKNLCRNYNIKDVIVCSDAHRETFRNELYKAYKGNRDETAQDLREQFGYMEEYLRLCHINFIKLPGFEADDLIGTLAKKARDYDYMAYIASGDKDLMQIIEDGYIEQLYLSNKGIQPYTSKEVEERFGGLKPIQIIDYKGLAGDSSDNIPGVSRIGDKTAIKLLNSYQTLDNVYAHIDDLKGAQKKNLIADKDMAYLSRTLATIKCDVPLNFDELFTMSSDMSLCTADAYDYLKKFQINIYHKSDIPKGSKKSESTHTVTKKSPTGAKQHSLLTAIQEAQEVKPPYKKVSKAEYTLNHQITSLELPFDICDTGTEYIFRSLDKYTGEATRAGLSVWLYALMYCPELRPLTMKLLKEGKELLCMEDETNIEKIAQMELERSRKK